MALFGDYPTAEAFAIYHHHPGMCMRPPATNRQTAAAIADRRSPIPMDDFALRALAAGFGVALVSGPLGCFVVWRRMAFFGSALSHSALLGVALGFLLGIDLTIGTAAVCVAVALLLVFLERSPTLSGDTLLGILAHGALALGLVALSFLDTVRVDLMGICSATSWR
jgi:ABC-type Mn2+/Zn2+ transport system permease subunit